MKATKRDIAILGAFLLVVVVGAGSVIVKQVSPSGHAASVESEDVILARTGPPPIPDTEIVPASGLDVASGEIADPLAFASDGASGGPFFAVRGGGTSDGGGGESGGGSSVEPAGGPSGPPSGMAPRGGGRGSVAGGTSGGGTVTVYIAALTTSGDRVSALIVRMDTGARRWVDQGGSAFGYTLDYANLKGAVLEANGRYYVLELGEGGQSTRTSTPAPGGGATVAQAQAPATGADASDAAKFVGTWTGTMQGMTMTFTYGAGGSGSMSMSQMPQPMRFRWRVEGGKLKVAMDMGGMGGPGANMEQALDYRFEGDRTVYVSGGMSPQEMKLTKN